jgi:hypothetical protein
MYDVCVLESKVRVGGWECECEGEVICQDLGEVNVVGEDEGVELPEVVE